MRMLSRIGRTSRLVAAAAVSFTLCAGSAMAQDGYVDVRVRDDSAGCGPVVIKWPADQEEREYDPNPGRNDPKLEMAETRPLPVIHHHPSLNAGNLYLPPQDGVYRHYFPESEAPPRLRRWNRAEYEEYLREHNPSVEIPFAEGVVKADPRSVPEMVIVPTGMVTPPVAFAGGPAGYVVVPGQASTGTADLSGVQDYPVEQPRDVVVQETVARVETAAPAPAFKARVSNSEEEGTGSFIHLSSIAEKVPFIGEPAPTSAEAPLTEVPFADVPFAELPAAMKAAAQTAAAVADESGTQQAYEPVVLPNDETLKIGKCGAPVCQ